MTMSVEPSSKRFKYSGMIRLAIAAALVLVLVYLCLQTGHAGLKGSPLETWRLVPLILHAATFAILGKRFLNSISGLFLGGIGGAFGSWDASAGPFGGMVGLLVGAIVITIPVMQKPRFQESMKTQNIAGRPSNVTDETRG